MKNIMMLIITTLLSTSCCVYHTSVKRGEKKISEFGIAPYSNRPMSQDDFDDDDDYEEFLEEDNNERNQ